MVKFLLVIQICSALHGDCLPKQNVNTYDSWYECARGGTYETIELILSFYKNKWIKFLKI